MKLTTPQSLHLSFSLKVSYFSFRWVLMPNKSTHTIWEHCLRFHRQSMHFCWKFARWRASSVSGIRSPLPLSLLSFEEGWIDGYPKKLGRRRNSQSVQSMIVPCKFIISGLPAGVLYEIKETLRIRLICWELWFSLSGISASTCKEEEKSGDKNV